MHKLFSIALLLLFCLTTKAQTQSARIDPAKISFGLVEDLFIEKLNQYRKSLSLGTLQKTVY